MSVSKSRRFKVLTRDRFTCRYCGRSAPTVELHVDHVQPVSRGGSDDESNLVAACVDCNSSKSGKPLPLGPISSVAAPPADATFPHLDRCGRCRGARLYMAFTEVQSGTGYRASYRCQNGHQWATYWANEYRLTRAALNALVSRHLETR